jgi:hypothetical protein
MILNFIELCISIVTPISSLFTVTSKRGTTMALYDDSRAGGSGSQHGNEPRPIRGVILLFLFVALLLGVTYLIVHQLPEMPAASSGSAEILFFRDHVLVGGKEYVLLWWAFVIPVGVLGFVLMRIIDIRGQVLGLMGTLISFGFPSFGKSLQSLRLWYDEPEKMEKLYLKEGGREEHLEGKHAFSKWMIAEIVHKYENNVQAMAYWGAALLIVLIGLRGMQFMSKHDPTLLLIGLELEFTLIFLFGLLIFYRPEDHTGRIGGHDKDIHAELEAAKETIRKHEELLKVVTEDLSKVHVVLEDDLKKLRN